MLEATRRRLPGAILVLAMHHLPAEQDALGTAWTEVPLEARRALPAADQGRSEIEFELAAQLGHVQAQDADRLA